MDTSAANFYVHANAPSLSVGGITVDPLGSFVLYAKGRGDLIKETV